MHCLGLAVLFAIYKEKTSYLSKGQQNCMHLGVFSAIYGAALVSFSSLVTAVNARPTKNALRAALLLSGRNHASYPPHNDRITDEAYVHIVTRRLLIWGTEWANEVAQSKQDLGDGNTFVCAVPTSATPENGAIPQSEIQRVNYSIVGG